MIQSKMSEVDIFKTKQKPLEKDTGKKETKSNAYIVKSFRIPADMADRLKEYTQIIAPGHLKITESDVIRYMIQNFDIEKAKEEFFKHKL